MKMPPPIATKFTKLVLTILAITILGIILSFISQDHTLLMLSAGVAVAGGVKIIDYYRTIKGALKGRLSGNRPAMQGSGTRSCWLWKTARWSRESWKADTSSRLEPSIASTSSGNRSPRSRLNSQKSSSRPSSSLVMKSCLFRQESRFRYSGRVPKRMICLLCSLLD